VSDRDRFILVVLLALWVLAWGYSFAAFALTAAEGSGFTRGLNRIEAFLGWQAIAGLLSLPVLQISRRWPRGSGVRRLGALPFACAALLILGLVGFFGWGMWIA